MRHAWAKAQIKSDGATPALLTYLQAFLEELDALKAELRGLEKIQRHPKLGIIEGLTMNAGKT